MQPVRLTSHKLHKQQNNSLSKQDSIPAREKGDPLTKIQLLLRRNTAGAGSIMRTYRYAEPRV